MSEIPSLGPTYRYETHDLKQAAEKLMRHKDTDGNGTLSAEELGGTKGSFEKIDTNADGQVDNAELMANKPRPLFNRIAAEAIRKLDVDGDKTLSADELEMPDERFDKLDKNQDGQIDKRELGGLLKQRDQMTELFEINDPQQDPTHVRLAHPDITIYVTTNTSFERPDSEDESDMESQQV